MAVDGARYAGDVQILLATDADWIIDEVTGALSSPDIGFVVVREGRHVSKIVAERDIDMAIFDLQIGSMGGMAATMDLRLDESSGAIYHVPVLMLLDRVADVHLARRSGAEGWMIKPLDALRLKRAVAAVANDEPYHEPMTTTGEVPTADEAEIGETEIDETEIDETEIDDTEQTELDETGGADTGDGGDGDTDSGAGDVDDESDDAVKATADE